MNKIACLSGLNDGTVDTIQEWLDDHPSATIVTIAFQSPFVYIVYTESA